MSLYLGIFDNDQEIAGVEVGYYTDFDFFRSTISTKLEKGPVGSRFPTLMLHQDCDGTWTPNDAVSLKAELLEIANECKKLPPVALNSEWQNKIVSLLGIKLQSLFDCFVDVDGESLIDRLLELSDLSIKYNLPILFQ